MKCTIRGEHFKQLIGKGGKATEQRMQNPLLGSVLLSAHKDQKLLRVKTTNLELWTECAVSASVYRDGEIAIPARPLAALVPYIHQNDEITLEQEENILKITTKTGKTALHGHQSKEFPLFPFEEKEQTQSSHKEGMFAVKSGVFLSSLKRALVSVARSNIKPELASVLMRFNPHELIIASTDGFRLTEDRLSRNVFSAYPIKEYDVLVPARSLEEIIRMFEEDDEEITGYCQEGMLSVSSPFARIIARTTEGAFPTYEQIIPSHFAVSLVIPRSQLIDILRQASIFSGKLYAISFSFSAKDNTLLFHTFSQDVGEFSSALAVQGTGEEREVVCNWRYFLDGIQGFSHDAITLSFTNESAPILMRDTNTSQGFYLLMPMRGM